MSGAGSPAGSTKSDAAVGGSGGARSAAPDASSPVRMRPTAAGRGAPSAGPGGVAGAGTASVAGSGEAGAGGSAGGNAGGASLVGAAGGGGAGGAAGAGVEGEALVRPPCLKNSSQVIAVGDSYLNWITHNFPDDFKQAFGDYRMYALPGASMASGGIAGFIPDQLTQAISEDKDILLTVMTGGGNDILIADTDKYPGSDACKDRTDSPTMQVCQDVIAGAMQTASELMQTAAAAGIQDVIYLFYPHIPGGGFGGMNPNAILAYSLPMARDLCVQAEANTQGQLRCHFLDLQPVFEGHDDWFADDGIHENAMGSAAMAQEVVKVMKDKCLAQPEASGCCEP